MDEDYGWMADTWGGGGYDWSGMPEYTSPAVSDPRLLPTSDPVSPYYTGGVSGDSSGGDFTRYMPGGSEYIPPGGGMWQREGGDWQGIYAPPAPQAQPQSYSPGMIPSSGGVLPAYSDINPSYRPNLNFNLNPASGGGGSFGGGMPAGGGGGPRGVAAMQPEMIKMGSPERTLYDRYSGLLQNPQGFASDPAYQFLFNQGEQALKRSLAAKRLTYSGKSLNDTMAYGQGMAHDYMNQLLPQYRAGAQEELARFLGPAGLLPRYAAQNNQTISQAGSEQAARDTMPQLSSAWMNSVGGGGRASSEPPVPTGPSFGGVRGGYDYTPRLEAAWSQPQGRPQPQPEPFNPYYTGYDREGGGPAYG